MTQDVVERLRYLASGSQLWEAGELSGIFRQSFTLIERLQKELGEARGIIRSADEKLAAAGLRSGCFMGCDTPDALADQIEVIRAKTIEECAAKIGELCGTEGMADELAKAIRSMDGGGK